MPASPGCSVRSRSSSCLRGSFFGTIRYWMFGRSKLATKCRAPPRFSRVAISARRGLGGGRGQRDPRHVGPALVQHRQRQVVGPEVVAPLGHAVRLVDGEQRDLAAVQQPHRRLGPQPLRRQVEQVELAGQERRLDPPPLVRVLGRVEEPGPHPQRGQRVDLVLHQRDQRRDDHAGAVPHQRGDLVAQRLAAAGRHQHERVAAGDDVVDDLLLLAAERVVAEHPPQHLQRPVGHRLRAPGNYCHAAILRARSVSVGPGGRPPGTPRCAVLAGGTTHQSRLPTRLQHSCHLLLDRCRKSSPPATAQAAGLHIPWNDQVQAECRAWIEQSGHLNPAPVSGTEHPAMSVPTGTLTTPARPRGQRRSQQTKSSSTRDCKRGSMKSPSQ